MTASGERRGRRTAAVAGGALLAWLLLRGGAAGAGRGRRLARVRIRVDAHAVTVDGRPATVEAAVASARAVGAAELVATGSARTGTVADLLARLRAAGVVVHATPPVLAVGAFGGGRAP